MIQLYIYMFLDMIKSFIKYLAELYKMRCLLQFYSMHLNFILLKMHSWGLESGFMNYGRPRLIVWETLYWPLRLGEVGVFCLSTIAASIGPGAGKGSNKPHWLPALMPSAYALETDDWVWALGWSLTTPWSRTSDFAATNLFSSFVIRMTAATMITASICWGLAVHQAVQKG